MGPFRSAGSIFASLALATCNRMHPVASAKDEASAPIRELRESRIEALVCAGRPDCHLESVVDGGKSGQGLFVAMVRVPLKDGWTAPCTSHDLWLGTAIGKDVSVVRRLVQPC